MSSRHLFQTPEGLVSKSLRGLISYNPMLSLDEKNRVVFDTTHDRANVSLISGGGSGHEPAWAGLVGQNMLTASVAGDIFSSPGANQVLAAIETTKSDQGTILVVPNYTGDCLHFGLASEKANAKGLVCRVIICGDDVSVGRSRSFVGRRGLPGHTIVIKALGAASGRGASLDDVFDLGIALADQIVSIAATLDHCHVPGRTEHNVLLDNEIELGTGPHNEPGFKKISPIPSPEDFVGQILTRCLDANDPERGYVKHAPGDETVLVVSNFGGMSYLEMGALVDELLEQLAKNWEVEPVRVYAGCIETSLNALAFSVSLVNISAAAQNCSYEVDTIKELLDAKTSTTWEAMAGAQKERRTRSKQIVHAPEEPERIIEEADDLRIDPALLDKLVKASCHALIKVEPDLTRWDMILGDGDCGQLLKTGATLLLSAMKTKSIASEGSVLRVLLEAEDILENKLGGTLGGILSIFFVALRTALEQQVKDKRTGPEYQGRLWTFSLKSAIESLSRYTKAKVGDRTVMDTLIPFVDAMVSSAGNLREAAGVAAQGAEATRPMIPKLGRATYVGLDAHDSLPPDPGAWGAMVVIKALSCCL